MRRKTGLPCQSLTCFIKTLACGVAVRLSSRLLLRFAHVSLAQDDVAVDAEISLSPCCEEKVDLRPTGYGCPLSGSQIVQTYLFPSPRLYKVSPYS